MKLSYQEIVDMEFKFRATHGQCKEQGFSVYFADNGNRCAIGLLLKEEQKADLIDKNDNNSPLKFLIKDGLLRHILKYADDSEIPKFTQFLIDMQILHDYGYTDSSINRYEWEEDYREEKFENLEKMYGVVVPREAVDAQNITLSETAKQIYDAKVEVTEKEKEQEQTSNSPN